jgi:hypothetical protein
VLSFNQLCLTLLLLPLLPLQASGFSAWDDPKLHNLLSESAEWQALQAELCRQELAGEQHQQLRLQTA